MRGLLKLVVCAPFARLFSSHVPCAIACGPESGRDPYVLQALLKMRGGIVKAKAGMKPKGRTTTSRVKRAKGPGDQTTRQKLKAFYLSTPWVTRTQLVMALALTVLTLGGLDPALLLLDPIGTVRELQIWRPLTAATFLGPPSMSWLSSLYFLYSYGTALEKIEGSAQHFIFVLFEIVLLSFLACLVGLPLTSSALITAALHCLGRHDPMRDVQWMFAIKVKYYMLPFCLAVVDMLQAQNPLAGLPAALGIFTGHLYYHTRYIWPSIGGKVRFEAPAWLARRMGGRQSGILEFTKPTADSHNTVKRKKLKGKSYRLSK